MKTLRKRKPEGLKVYKTFRFWSQSSQAQEQLAGMSEEEREAFKEKWRREKAEKKGKHLFSFIVRPKA